MPSPAPGLVLEGGCDPSELIHALVASLEFGEVASARQLILCKEEQCTDFPPVGQEFRDRAAGFVGKVPQEAGIGWAMPRVDRRGGYQEASTIKGIAPVDLEAAHDRGGAWSSGERGNPTMLLDRENGRHRSLGAQGGVRPPRPVAAR
jgi:hypothetical protein